MPVRRHGLHIHRKIGIRHLLFQSLLHGLGLTGKGVEEEVILGIVKRLEERDAVNMVPMIVREKDKGMNALVPKLLHQALA